MPRKKKDSVPLLIVPKNATLKQIYAAGRKQFTAAELQRFTEPSENIPVEQVIAELEAIQRRESRKRRKRA